MAGETDIVASEVPSPPTFFLPLPRPVSALTPTEPGGPGRQGQTEARCREICKHGGERDTRGGRAGGGWEWSAALTVVTDVEFSTKKLCQQPSRQGEVS